MADSTNTKTSDNSASHQTEVEITESMNVFYGIPFYEESLREAAFEEGFQQGIDKCRQIATKVMEDKGYSKEDIDDFLKKYKLI